MSTQDLGLPDIRIDQDSLYREETFTDRRAGTLRRLVPVLADGSPDAARPVLWLGQTQLMTPGGVLPLGFEIDAPDLASAIEKFPEAVKQALEDAIEEAQQMRREAASRIVGFANAADILLTGRTFDGDEARAMSLCSRVTPNDEVLDVAMEIAHDIAVNVAPASAAASKRALWESMTSTRERIDALETELHHHLMRSPDAREGVEAFLERRPPRWSGSPGKP